MEPLSLFKCGVCSTFLESLAEGEEHLRVRHNRAESSGTARRSSAKLVLEKVRFPLPKLELKREEGSGRSRPTAKKGHGHGKSVTFAGLSPVSSASPPRRSKSKPRSKGKSASTQRLDRRVEVKLERLTSAEIARLCRSVGTAKRKPGPKRRKPVKTLDVPRVVVASRTKTGNGIRRKPGPKSKKKRPVKAASVASYSSPIKIKLEPLDVEVDESVDFNDNEVDINTGDDEQEQASSQLQVFKKPRARPRKYDNTVTQNAEGQVEIKLEELKASEIEALISNMYTGSGSEDGNNGSSPNADTQSLSFGPTGGRKRAAALNAKKVIAQVTIDEDADPDPDIVPKKRRPGRKSLKGEKANSDEEEYKPSGLDYARAGIQEEEDEVEIVSSSSDDDGGEEHEVVEEYDEKELAKHLPYWCLICGPTTRFELWPILNDHLDSAHKNEDGRYCCSRHCKRTFSTLHKLRGHVRTWRKKFGLKWRLRNNMERKAGLYSCEICFKKFRYKTEVDAHLEAHKRRDSDPRKTFSCPLCTVRFVKSHSLIRHFIIHLDNNPFVCKFTGCGIRFSANEHLQRHVLLHTDVRTHKCDQCGKLFRRNDSLQKHIRAVHDETRVRKRIRYVRKSSYRVPSAVTVVLEDGKEVAPWSAQPHPEVNGSSNSAELETERRDDNGSETNGSAQNGEKDPEKVIYPSKEGFNGTASEQVKQEKDDEEQLRWELDSQHISLSDHEQDVEEPDEAESASNTIKKEADNDNNNILDVQLKNQGETRTFGQYNIRALILADPVYQNLLKSNPEGAASVLPPMDGYGTYRMSRQTFSCSECNWTGSRAHFLKLHLRKYHNKNDSVNFFKAKGDGENKASGESEKVGPEGSSETEPKSTPMSLMCGTCGHQSTSAADLAEHMEKEHPIARKFACAYCTSRFETLKRKLAHERQHVNGLRTYCCSECPVKYKNPFSLKKHEREKHNPNYLSSLVEFKCTICKKQLLSKFQLNTHMKVRHGDADRRTCKLCGQTCATWDSLKRHISYIHMDVENPYNKKQYRISRKNLLQKQKEEEENKVEKASVTAETGYEVPSPPTENTQVQAESHPDGNASEELPEPVPAAASEIFGL